jgi:hypothetical protein
MGLYETDREGMTSLLGPSLSLVMKLGGGSHWTLISPCLNLVVDFFLEQGGWQSQGLICAQN